MFVCMDLQQILYSTIPASRMTPLNGVNNFPKPILHNVGDVPDCVAVREEIPAAGAVAVVVQPGAEN